MRIGLSLALLLLVCAMSAFGELNETWEFSASLSAGDDSGTLAVKQTGQALEGMYSGILGRNLPIKGQIDGKTVTFVVKGEWPDGGGQVEAKVTGEVQDGSVSGTVTIANHGSGTWRARRTSPQKP